MKGKHPYKTCPTYASEHFLLRLVEPRDADDLLICYSDAASVRLMNADNCTSDFHYGNSDEMDACIQDWLGSYQRSLYVRFAVVDTRGNTAVGTIEMYDRDKTTGILRLDLRSAYEQESYIAELIGLSVQNFYDAFGVQQILTKAIPLASGRIAALLACGFAPAEDKAVMPFGDYYARWA